MHSADCVCWSGTEQRRRPCASPSSHGDSGTDRRCFATRVYDAAAGSSTVRLLAAVRAIIAALDEVPDAALPMAVIRPSLCIGCRPCSSTDHFALYPEALETIGRIIDDCEPSLPDGRPIWPDLRLTAAATPSCGAGAVG